MENEKILSKILAEQSLNQNQKRRLKDLRMKVRDQLEEILEKKPTVYYAGSYRKKTMIKASYDLDIVLLWSSKVSTSVKDLYTKVGSELQKNWNKLRAKKVGWEIGFDGDFHIDVIPGKRKHKSQRQAYLYNREIDGRFLTSIIKQVNYIKRRRRGKVIKLMKLWVKRKEVPIKTFILELMVVKGCKYLPRKDLDLQLKTALKFIADNINTIRLEDPANHQNIITNNLTKEEKDRIRVLATQAIETKNWNQVFFN